MARFSSFTFSQDVTQRKNTSFVTTAKRGFFCVFFARPFYYCFDEWDITGVDVSLAASSKRNTTCFPAKKRKTPYQPPKKPDEVLCIFPCVPSTQHHDSKKEVKSRGERLFVVVFV